MKGLLVCAAIWLACIITVLVVNLPPGIREMKKLSQELEPNERAAHWFWFFFWAGVTTTVFAPLTLTMILVRGGRNNFEEDD